MLALVLAAALLLFVLMKFSFCHFCNAALLSAAKLFLILLAFIVSSSLNCESGSSLNISWWLSLPFFVSLDLSLLKDTADFFLPISSSCFFGDDFFLCLILLWLWCFVLVRYTLSGD